MHRSGVGIAILLGAAAIAGDATAGIRYEFRQTTRSEVRRIPSVETQGEAWLDGERMRIDYRGPSSYGDNASLIANGARTLWILDRENKRYHEVTLSSDARNLASASISVANVRSGVEKAPGPSIAGFPTEHWKLTTTYDMRVSMGEISLEQRVETVIEKWTTQAFGELVDPLASNESFKTGNAQLDQLIELETTRVTGFPLRQTVTITTRDIKERKRARGELDLTVPRRQTSEMLVTSIEFAEPPPRAFELPAGFEKVNPADRSGVTAVTLTP